MISTVFSSGFTQVTNVTLVVDDDYGDEDNDSSFIDEFIKILIHPLLRTKSFSI